MVIPAHLILAELENLHEVIAVEFAVEVSVAVPGVREVFDPDAMVVLRAAAFAVHVERGIRQPHPLRFERPPILFASMSTSAASRRR